MAELVSQEEFDTYLDCGRILFFPNPMFPEYPHPHVSVVNKDGNVVLMACGTSKKATIERYLAATGLSNSSVVWVDHNDSNGLFKETYFNCNSMPYEFSRAELLEMYNRGEMEIWGNLSIVDYDKLLRGFVESDLIDTWLQDLLRPLLDD